MKIKDPHFELSEAILNLESAKERGFFASNGRVFFGEKPKDGDSSWGGLYRYHLIVQDANWADDLADQLNEVVSPSKTQAVAMAEDRLAKARKAIVDVAAE
jgi:hypothetical protein